MFDLAYPNLIIIFISVMITYPGQSISHGDLDAIGLIRSTKKGFNERVTLADITPPVEDSILFVGCGGNPESNYANTGAFVSAAEFLSDSSFATDIGWGVSGNWATKSESSGEVYFYNVLRDRYENDISDQSVRILGIRFNALK